MIAPDLLVINGSGRPRIIAEIEASYTSKGSLTYTDTTVTEADGASFNIIGVTADANGNVNVEYNDSNKYAVGDYVIIAGVTGGSPDINGTHQVVMIPSATKIQIELTFVSAGTGGTIHRSGDAELNGAIPGLKIQSVFTDTNSVQEESYGKIVDIIGNTIVVDKWSAGTPSNADAFSFTGHVIDLPYCNEFKEFFTPDTLVHNLYQSRKKVKERGYFYRISLDYSKRVYGDMLVDMQMILDTSQHINLVLIPRADVPGFSYNVFFDPQAAMTLSMIGKGRAHKNLVFVFVGKETVNSFPISLGYGDNYGMDYGNSL